MRIFKNKVFNKWAEDLLTDDSLLEAAKEIVDGNYEAPLGKKVYKKRVALDGAGKRGGSRIIVAYQEGSNLFFLYAFKKNAQGNISDKDKKGLQELARIYLSLSEKELNKEVKDGRLFEIKIEQEPDENND